MKFLTIMLATLFLALPRFASATAQAPDRLVIDGEKVALETNPLRPLIRSGAIDLPKPDESWTSNWRGYVATWEIRGSQLFLTAIDVRLRPAGDPDAKATPTNVISTVFAGQTDVLARWFTGTLVLPRGKVTNYVHMGYGSIHENYTIVQIRLGQVVYRDDLTAAEFEALKKQRFSAYKKTAEYAERYREARENLSPSSAENFIYEYSVEEYVGVSL